MSVLGERFLGLSLEERKSVKIVACRFAYSMWLESFHENENQPEVDVQLPLDAIEAIATESERADILSRYADPIAAMRSGDLDFGEDENLMYFSISNFYEQQYHSLKIGDWTIINQALAGLSKKGFEGKLSELLELDINA